MCIKDNSILAFPDSFFKFKANVIQMEGLTCHSLQVLGFIITVINFFTCCAGLNDLLLMIQLTPVISRQLGVKIRERELSGSVISRFCAKAMIRDLLDYRPTFSRWQLPNNMLSNNRGTFHGSLHTWTSCQRQITTSTLYFNNHATKLSNCTLRKATHDGFCAEIIQTTLRFDRKQKWFRACMASFTNVAWASRWQIPESYFK